MSHINSFSVAMSLPFHRTGVNVSSFPFIILVMMHPHTSGTDWISVLVKTYIRPAGQRRTGFFTVFGERNKRYNIFRLKVIIMGIRVMMSVTDENVDMEIQAMLAKCFQKAVQSFQRESVIAFIAPGHDRDENEVVTVLSDDDMIVAVSKDKTVPVMIIAPFGSGTCQIPVMICEI